MADWWEEDEVITETGDDGWWSDDEVVLAPAPSEFVDVYDNRRNFLGRRPKTEDEHNDERLKGYLAIETIDGEGRRIQGLRRATSSERNRKFEGMEGAGPRARAAATAGTIEDIQRNLGEQFDLAAEGFEVYQNEQGDRFFRHPELNDNAPNPLDEIGLDLGDVSAVLTELPVILGEAAGGIAGLSRGGPAGLTIGAPAGAAAGRTASNALLEATGIVEDPDYVADAALDAGLSYAGTKAPGAAQMLKNAIKPTDRALDIIDPNLGGVVAGKADEPMVADAIDAGMTEARSMGVADDLTTGQVIQQAPGGKAIGGDILSTERQMADQGAQTARARRSELRRAELEESLRAPVDEQATDVGGTIQQAAAAQSRLDASQVAEDIGREIDALEQVIEGAVRGTGDEAANIRLTMESGREKVFERLSKQYDALWENVPDGIPPDLTELEAAAERWKSRLDKQIFQSLILEDRGVIGDALKAVERASVKGTDIYDLQRDLTRLKKEMLALDSVEGMGRQKAILQDFITEVEAARYNALKSIDPDLADDIKLLDFAWATAKSDIDEGLVGAVIRKKRVEGPDGNPVYTIDNDDVLKEITKNAEDLRHYLQIGETYPELNAVADVKSAMRHRYWEDVVDGGMNHKTWLRRNKAALDEVFTPAEKRAFSTANKAKTNIANAMEAEKVMLARIQEETGIPMGSYDAQKAADWAAGDVQKTNRLKQILGPDEWESYKNYRARKVAEDLGENPSLTALDNMLKDNSRRELEASVGRNYVSNLILLRNLTKAQSAKGGRSLMRSTSAEAGSVWDTLRFLVYGPLDRTGARINRVLRFGSAGVNKQLETLLGDPQMLAEALRLRDATIRNRKYWQFLGALGFNTGALAADLNDPRIPVKTGEE